MQHHRRAQRRNRIRGLAIPRQRAAGSGRYHTNCWAEVRASPQRDYEEKVRSAGLVALLAPHLYAPSLTPAEYLRG